MNISESELVNIIGACRHHYGGFTGNIYISNASKRQKHWQDT